MVPLRYASSPPSLSLSHSLFLVSLFLPRTGFRHITFADYRLASRSMSSSHPRDTYLPRSIDPLLSLHLSLSLRLSYLRDWKHEFETNEGTNEGTSSVSLLRFKPLLDFTPRALRVCYLRIPAVKSLLDTRAPRAERSSCALPLPGM